MAYTLDQLIEAILKDDFQNLNRLDVVFALRGAKETIERLEEDRGCLILKNDSLVATLQRIRDAAIKAVGLPPISNCPQLQ
jgi:hypothetical protein